ncbi:hypothetical protein, partial [Mycolicibacterium setense]|uniref:hypothetical protein n=1 Tax=Mycolicibacterium setense TaxID=431269 RepID=UPI001A962C5E
VTKGLQEAGQFSVAAHWSVFSCRRQKSGRGPRLYRKGHQLEADIENSVESCIIASPVVGGRLRRRRLRELSAARDNQYFAAASVDTGAYSNVIIRQAL